MKYAYADPPYLGCGQRLYGVHHPDAADWDNPAEHQRLIDRLVAEYPDGWAMSLHTPSLATILPMCPDDVRVCAWVKPFAVFKPNVNPGYCWEPVILRGGRTKRDRTEPTVRDYLAEPIALKKRLPGAKPLGFCMWILDLLGYRNGDTLDDLFPGTDAMGDAVETRQSQLDLWSDVYTQPEIEAMSCILRDEP